MIDNSDPRKHEIAYNIFVDMLNIPSKYIISIQVLSELINSIRLKNRKALKLSYELINNIIEIHIKIVSYDLEIFKLSIYEENIWNALMAYTYALNNASEILTENIRDMPNIKGVKYINPFV